MDTEKFVGGMRVTRHERAPQFVKASIGVNIGDFIAWADRHSKNGWVNFQIKESKSGKLYAQLDEYEAGKTKPQVSNGEVRASELPDNLGGEKVIEYPTEEINPADILF